MVGVPIMNRSTAKAGVVLIFSLGLAGQLFSQDKNSAEDSLGKLFHSFLEGELKRKPLEATRLGDHRYDHDLEDLTPAARANWQKAAEQTLGQLKEISFEQLPTKSQTDYQVFEAHLERVLWASKNTNPYEEDPRVYSEYLSDSLFLLLTQNTLPESKNVASVISRVGKMPTLLGVAEKTLRNPPKVYVETAIKQNRGTIRFYRSGIGLHIQNEENRKRVLEATEKVIPRLQEYQEFLEKVLLPRATEDWRIGSKKFNAKMQHELQMPLSAEQVFQKAEKEMVQVELEMHVIARELWPGLFPGKVFPPYDPAGRRLAIAQVLEKLAENRAEEKDLLPSTKQTVDSIKQFIKERKILDLPEPDRCQIVEMPEFQRGNSVAYLNQAPPLDPAAASIYAVSPPPADWDLATRTSFMKEYNAYMLPILTIHEAYPGHYVQLEYSNRTASKIRKVFFSGVFAEGWAVYTEKMMLDEGFGKGSLPLRLHQLKWYLRTVANAVLDHNMHCQNWTDDQALEFLTQRAFQSKAEALGKIIRSKQSSCQLTTYFAGASFFNQLRAEVQNSLGGQFQLSRFHHAVLNHGTIPPKLVGPLVKRELGLPN
ncbi:MAG: DUF885 domain-containing protein [Gemmataceae bacterium]|nr:DUF885 domain-containing protein [Gemmataceae bacterium]